MDTKINNKTAPQVDTPLGIALIRLSIGYIYLHFGLLKLYPDFSPAEILADYTVQLMTFHMLDFYWAQMIVAVLEIVIGVGLLFNIFMRYVGVLYFFHILCTFLPLFLMPEFVFSMPPFGLQVEGQYVIKNVVLVAAGWALFAPYYEPMIKARFASAPA
jgi:uncharacterized membrane protein YkgB